MGETYEPITVAGITFANRCPTHPNVFYSPQHILKMQFGGPHPNRVNDLNREVEILKALWSRKVRCIPEVLASGLWEGNPYVVMNRIFLREERPTYSAVMHSFKQVMRCGYLHGDLKQSNIIWDGCTAFLIDFDQTVYDPSIAAMSIQEACAWSGARRQEQPWKNCYSLRDQLFTELPKYARQA